MNFRAKKTLKDEKLIRKYKRKVSFIHLFSCSRNVKLDFFMAAKRKKVQ